VKKSFKYFQFFLIFYCIPIATQAQEISRSHYINAKEFLKSDSLQQAIIELDSATKIAPNFAEAYALKGLIWERKGEYRRALSQYSLAILHNPANASLYVKRAELHFILKDHRDYILKDVNNAIDLLPNKADLYALKAYYYVKIINPATLKPDYENAIKELNTAIYLDNENANYLKTRSQYKFENGQRLSALADISAAIEKDDTNDSFYHYRGLIRFMLGDYRSALPDLSKAIKLNSTRYDYFQLRGNVLYNLGKY
jgi:tetratricopeptide (TPR) repeat protein